MRSVLTIAAGAIGLGVATPAFAHRVDEYLQATTISISKDRIRAEVRLTPGTEVFTSVRALIDTDFDGAFSPVEQRAYVDRVLRDLMLRLDGDRLPLELVASAFPSMDEMRDGRGAIEIDFEAVVTRGARDRRLEFENRHQRSIAAYLVNGLVPQDPDVRVRGQHRDYLQSTYRMDYTDAGATETRPLLSSWADATGWLFSVIVLSTSLVMIVRRRARWSWTLR